MYKCTRLHTITGTVFTLTFYIPNSTNRIQPRSLWNFLISHTDSENRKDSKTVQKQLKSIKIAILLLKISWGINDNFKNIEIKNQNFILTTKVTFNQISKTTKDLNNEIQRKTISGYELFSRIGLCLNDALEFRHRTQNRKEKLTVWFHPQCHVSHRNCSQKLVRLLHWLHSFPRHISSPKPFGNKSRYLYKDTNQSFVV